MKFEDLSPEAQNVITVGCRMLGRDPEAFFDTMKAELIGSEKYLSGWKEIADAMNLTYWKTAMRRAQSDPLLAAIIKRCGNRVTARRSDIIGYMEHTRKNWKKSAA